MNMKPEFQVKFLQHLKGRKNGEEGFTLIELLVVIIIIGILAAIALPSLLGQANKARQSEAKNNIGAINRAQQGYYLEKQAFATDLATLGAGVRPATENFGYAITDAGTVNAVPSLKKDGSIQDEAQASQVTNADPQSIAAVAISPSGGSLKSYVGLTTLIPGSGGGENLTSAAACESIKTGSIKDGNAISGIPIAGGTTGLKTLDCGVISFNGENFEDLGG
ncbi:type IV pilin-like G/H family protein [Spirulina sp. CS-785/01]|uniref:type IV pilin-like G/H family protein n=1 Tax=Spirulina sp. CS-785/01 TaxID=3021716 RepID=UPI00232E3961|nr:type IV pilin-like G/H family protein [Spirulina sp. CS-785/01]MDB9312740.1 type IV pilin-like G/H family protein [Spirulina sp. CS-785/01]